MSKSDDNVPELNQQDNVCVVLEPALEDVERDEEFPMSQKHSYGSSRSDLEYVKPNVENKK